MTNEPNGGEERGVRPAHEMPAGKRPGLKALLGSLGAVTAIVSLVAITVIVFIVIVLV